MTRRKPLSTTARPSLARNDITGLRFGFLVAEEFYGRVPQGNALTLAWRCRCDCGNERIASRPNLVAGRVKSCGCSLGMKNRGASKSPSYGSYRAMLTRCHDPNSKDYARWGARGIEVCLRWREGDGTKNGFQCFIEDMGEKPSPKHSIDRKDGSKGYEPDNCRWATASEQAWNTCRNYFKDGSDPKQLCREVGVKYGTFRARVANGWSVAEALTPRKYVEAVVDGVPLTEIARECGVPYRTLFDRFQKGERGERLRRPSGARP